MPEKPCLTVGGGHVGLGHGGSGVEREDGVLGHLLAAAGVAAALLRLARRVQEQAEVLGHGSGHAPTGHGARGMLGGETQILIICTDNEVI